MTITLYAILLALAAGASAFCGALLARFEKIQPNWLESEIRHGIMAFGGGALLAAVALVLVPDGMENQPPWLGIGTFLLGAFCFMMIDRYLAKKGTPFSQWMAMMLDFVPEAIVLGAVIAGNFRQAVFMAVIIAAQNFPEGFNAYREITSKAKGWTHKHVMVFMGVAVILGPVFTLFGRYAFDPHSMFLGTLMTFCAGGILYLVFHDIAPQAKLERHWLPSFGAIFGFVVGMIGKALI